MPGTTALGQGGEGRWTSSPLGAGFVRVGWVVDIELVMGIV